jgi:SAM-dependent methyltransferase
MKNDYNKKSSNHEKVYKKAELYDIAFDFRDIPRECDFLEKLFFKSANRKPDSFLELGAGPAYHTIEFARRGLKVTALDLSEDMVRYGLSKAKENGISIEYICADMIGFKPPGKYDLAVLLMDSATYLLDNQSVYDHFECVADCLNENGLYILEMSHPRQVFKVGDSEIPEWTMERAGKKVQFRWGEEGDHFDPITQISDITVRVKYSDENEEGEIIDKAKGRCFTANEFQALVDASARFKIISMYGSMDEDIPFDNDKKAWRMVPVLQKV